MDLRTLRDARPDDLLAAADAYARLSTAFEQHSEVWASGVEGGVRNSGWRGNAADRADTSLHATTGKLGAARTELGRIAPILREGAEAFLIAQAKLRTALADAAEDGYRVDEDGSVSWPPSDSTDLIQETVRNTNAALIGGRIGEILQEAAHADQVTAERLRHYTDNARTGAGLDQATAGTDAMTSVALAGLDENLVSTGIPGKNASPTEVNAWWKALPPEEQQRLIQHHPEEIGNRDGIPSPARDRANRINLDRTITTMQGRHPLSPADQEKLAGFQRIKERLAEEDGNRAKTPSENPQAYLLALEDTGQGRAAISFGNPDTADDVVSYVPGLGTKVGNVGEGDGNRAKDLWSASKGVDPSRQVASIVWLGYDAPQKDGVGTESLAVAGTERAEQGGEAYQGFLQGLRASHEGQPAHMTALGHSYGSFTMSQAAQRPGGIPVDDIIIVGSPGTGVQHAGQLGIDPSRVWVGAAENDPVSHLPSGNEAGWATAGALAGAGLGPAGMATGFGIGGLVGHTTDPHELWFGQDPASNEYGANRFRVADGPIGFDSHSDYWDSDPYSREPSTSLSNMAQVVTGHGGAVSRQEKR
ncbi:alpha/beta hydrolase [Kitasatospora sp. NPDC088134]|uniref:alpha/beta hydrolase n=1 Tax=Kitasatospora sp. NPDC088134 TaxID=3364071 RepID=UPI0038086B1B